MVGERTCLRAYGEMIPLGSYPGRVLIELVQLRPEKIPKRRRSP